MIDCSVNESHLAALSETGGGCGNMIGAKQPEITDCRFFLLPVYRSRYKRRKSFYQYRDCWSAKPPRRIYWAIPSSFYPPPVFRLNNDPSRQALSQGGFAAIKINNKVSDHFLPVKRKFVIAQEFIPKLVFPRSWFFAKFPSGFCQFIHKISFVSGVSVTGVY